MIAKEEFLSHFFFMIPEKLNIFKVVCKNGESKKISALNSKYRKKPSNKKSHNHHPKLNQKFQLIKQYLLIIT